jgi:TrmH family RNA methyltransferase
MTITSPHHEKLKQIRRLARARNRAAAGRFVAEGEDLLAAADAAGWEPLERFCAAGSGLGGVEVQASILAEVSGLGSGTRALAVYAERWAEVALGPLCVYLHGVSDPGNVGAVLRSAEAFGASSVAIGAGTADPYGPKAVRAGMGATFGVPVARVAEPSNETLPGTTIALVAGAGVPLSELSGITSTPRTEDRTVRADAGAGLTILVGSERHGLPEALTEAAGHTAHIPIRSHSLNAAMAATVALYELTHRMGAR